MSRSPLLSDGEVIEEVVTSQSGKEKKSKKRRNKDDVIHDDSRKKLKLDDVTAVDGRGEKVHQSGGKKKRKFKLPESEKKKIVEGLCIFYFIYYI